MLEYSVIVLCSQTVSDTNVHATPLNEMDQKHPQLDCCEDSKLISAC